MASTVADDGSEDVNDFLARIRDVGDQRDRDDDARKLEEEIMKGRQERAARRAERARSISPSKDSPASMLSSSTATTRAVLDTPTPHAPDVSPSKQPEVFDAPNPTPPAMEPSKPDPPAQPSLGRSNTLSWQQRPSSRTSTTVRSRPLSVVATENSVFRSPSATPEPTTKEEPGSATVKNPQNASSPDSRSSTHASHPMTTMFADKDPSWFRQTADRGKGSAAYRKSEEPEQESFSRSGSIRMPGLSREPSNDVGKVAADTAGAKGKLESTTSGTRANLDSIRLDPPSNESESRSPAMSPSQGRISPDRMDRPSSPTKGMGGFVQSAMLKRSDSVNKRWSAQVQGGLSRGNSAAGNRTSRDLGSGLTTRGGDARSPSPTKEPVLDQTKEEKEDEVPKEATGSSSPTKERGRALPEAASSRPSSPSKDTRRWSPVKSSWLENAINKPESPRPQKPATTQQPAWMAELQKAKAARASVDMSKKAADATPASPAAQTGTFRGNRPMSTIQAEAKTPQQPESSVNDASGSKKAEQTGSQDESRDELESSKASSPDAKTSLVGTGKESAFSKAKPATPPKKDFRSSLKQRSVDIGKPKEDVPEFKKAFGNLKKAETKNYVAPDTLKENITTGKAGLNVTGGPQKTQRVDEFKESILAKKKEFSAAPSKPPAKNPSQNTSKAVPEALAARSGMLNRTKSISDGSKSGLSGASKSTEGVGSVSEKPPVAPLPAVQPSQVKSSALASRFNPNLAGLLAKGPPGPTSPSPERPSTTTKATSDAAATKGPDLTHATKGRARGPKRKPPSSKQTELSKPGSAASSSFEKPSPAPKNTISSVEQPSDSLEDKMRSYNDIKASLVGNVGKIDSLGISGTEKPSPSSIPHGKPVDSEETKRLSVTKAKPPAPKSPSSRVISTSKSPATATSTPEPTTEPLSTLTKTSNRVNPGDKPSTPAKKSIDTGIKSSPANTASPKPKPPSPEIKRMSTRTPTIEQKPPKASPKPSERPSQPPSPELKRGVKSPAQQVEVSKSPRSPPVPVKSAAARTFTATRADSDVVTSQASSAKQAIEDFFGPIPESKAPPSVDAQSILKSNSTASDKIRSLRKQIWELTSDGKRMSVPAQQEHILFEDCMYVCTHVFGSAAGKHTSEAYLWVGDGVSPSAVEDAQLFAKNIAKEAGATGRLSVLHQGKETNNFFEALGGIVITRKGSGKETNPTYMLCGRKHMGQMAFDEVEFGPGSLCSGFPFIIAAAGGMHYLWKGKGSGADELGCARLIAMDLGLTGEIEEVDDGQEPAMFWVALEDSETDTKRIGQHWPSKANKDNFTTRLYSIDDARPKSAGLGALWGRRASTPGGDDPGTADIHEIRPFAQSDLSQEGIYVLDAYFEVYVILCWRSSARFPAFKTAAYFAQEYAILAASEEDRPMVPAAHVVFSGASLPYLKTAFRKWDERRVTTQPVGTMSDTSTITVHEAIAALTE